MRVILISASKTFRISNLCKKRVFPLTIRHLEASFLPNVTIPPIKGTKPKKKWQFFRTQIKEIEEFGLGFPPTAGIKATL